MDLGPPALGENNFYTIPNLHGFGKVGYLLSPIGYIKRTEDAFCGKQRRLDHCFYHREAVT